MSHRPHTIRVWDARTLCHIAKIGRGQPEFMISLVSGEDPEFLIAELERMGVVLPETEKRHLGAAADRSMETTVRVFKSPIRRRDGRRRRCCFGLGAGDPEQRHHAVCLAPSHHDARDRVRQRFAALPH